MREQMLTFEASFLDKAPSESSRLWASREVTKFKSMASRIAEKCEAESKNVFPKLVSCLTMLMRALVSAPLRLGGAEPTDVKLELIGSLE